MTDEFRPIKKKDMNAPGPLRITFTLSEDQHKRLLQQLDAFNNVIIPAREAVMHITDLVHIYIDTICFSERSITTMEQAMIKALAPFIREGSGILKFFEIVDYPIPDEIKDQALEFERDRLELKHKLEEEERKKEKETLKEEYDPLAKLYKQLDEFYNSTAYKVAKEKWRQKYLEKKYGKKPKSEEDTEPAD